MSIRWKSVTAFAAVVVLSCSTARGQVNTQRGATVGGIAGAVIGTAVGDNNGKAGTGAAIGGVLGAVAGGLLGNAKDKQAAIDAQRAQYHHQQQQLAHIQQAVTLNDVVQMTRSGLGESVIMNQIHSRGVVQKLSVQDIIALHEQGVSENVITTMQTARARPQTVARTPVIVEQPVVERVITPAPVIIHQPVLPHYSRPRYHRHYRPRVGSSFHIRF